MTRRMIDTGRGVSVTNMTPTEIATRRLTDDPELFLDTFARVRSVARGVGDLDTLWAILGGSHVDHTMEAAAIEALASLRADGVRV